MSGAVVGFIHRFDGYDTVGEIYNPIVVKRHFFKCVLLCKCEAVEVVESLVQFSLSLSNGSCVIDYLVRLLLCDCIWESNRWTLLVFGAEWNVID